MASAYGPRRSWNAAPGRGDASGKKIEMTASPTADTTTSSAFGADMFDFPESDEEPRKTTRVHRTQSARKTKSATATPVAPSSRKRRNPSVKLTTSDSDAGPIHSGQISRQQSHERQVMFEFPRSGDEGQGVVKEGTKAGLARILEVKTPIKKGKSKRADAETNRKRKREEVAVSSSSQPSHEALSKRESPKRQNASPKLTKNTLPLGKSKPKPSKKANIRASPKRLQAAQKQPMEAKPSPPRIDERMTRSRSRSKTPAPMELISMSTPTTPKNQRAISLRTPSPSRNTAIPTTAIKIAATPRQTALWNKLLDDQKLENLQVSSLRLTSRTAAVPSEIEPEEAEEPTLKRMRLVDLLQDSGRTPVVTSDDETDDSVSDLDVEDQAEMSAEPDTQSTRFTNSQTLNRHKIRYGQQRSYIADQDEDVIFDMLMEDSARQPLTLSSQKKGEFDLGESDDEGDSSQLRSMQDLRAAGSKKRMLYELQSLISGVKGESVGSLSARRFELLQLADKLIETSTAQAFLNHGLESLLLDTFAQSTDAVFNFLAATCLVVIVKQIKSLPPVRAIWRSGLPTRLFELLELDQDVSRLVKDREHNMTKIAQASIVDFKDKIFKEEFWGNGDVPERYTPNVLALKAIELLVRKMRELGSEEALLDERKMLRLLQNSSLGSPPLHRKLVLSTLESNSVGGLSKRGGVSTRSLEKLCSSLAQVLADASSPFETRNLGLRLALNLTNNQASACSIFSTRVFVAALVDLILNGFVSLTSGDLKVLDELILALGAMINLAELSDESRVLVLAEEKGEVLRRVVGVFQAGLARMEEADSVEASATNVPYGYLALLLVNLCQNGRVRAHVLSLLKVAQLDRLIQAAEEFISIHQRTDREMKAAVAESQEDADGDLGEFGEELSSERKRRHGDGGDEFTNRLLGMVRKLKMMRVES